MTSAYINLGNYDKAAEALKKMPAKSIYQIAANIYLAYISKKQGDAKNVNKLLEYSEQTLQKYLSQGDEFNPDAIDMSFIEILKEKKN